MVRKRIDTPIVCSKIRYKLSAVKLEYIPVEPKYALHIYKKRGTRKKAIAMYFDVMLMHI